MKRLVLLSLAACAVPAGAQPRFAGELALPGVLCDCDPADFVFRTTRRITGHAAPDAAGDVVRRVDAGRLIEGNDWSEALTVITETGVAIARDDAVLADVHAYGDARYVEWPGEDRPTRTLAIARGDTLEVLAADQGYVWYRHAGALYGGRDPMMDDGFAVLRRPTEAIWFHLVPRAGRPSAWVEIRYGDRSDANVEMLCETHGGCRGQ